MHVHFSPGIIQIRLPEPAVISLDPVPYPNIRLRKIIAAEHWDANVIMWVERLINGNAEHLFTVKPLVLFNPYRQQQGLTVKMEGYQISNCANVRVRVKPAYGTTAEFSLLYEESEAVPVPAKSASERSG